MGDVGGGQALRIAQQDPGHVERDVPDPDHGDRARLPEIGQRPFGMTVVPGDV